MASFLSSANLRGILLMIAARLVFAASDTFTRLASQTLPASEVVVMRNAIALPIVLVLVWRMNAFGALWAVRTPAVLWRSLLEGMGLITFVMALPHVQLGQSTVILLTMPIILVMLSAFLYKEDVDWRRWLAIIAGFLGVFLVAGPLGGSPNLYLLLTLVTAVTWAVRDLITSRIRVGIPSVIVSLLATVVGALIALPGAMLGDWRAFDARELVFLLFAGGFVAAANNLYISALRTGAVAVVAPFRYSAAMWASLAEIGRAHV